MSIRDFLKTHRNDIDDTIRANGGERFNDDERRLWIANDEGLYQLAKHCHVNVSNL